MARMRQLQVKTYRGVRLVVLDDGTTGWLVRVFLPGEANFHGLRNRAPNGLGDLIEEAKVLIDRFRGDRVPADYP